MTLCEICGEREAFHIHHKDGNRENNDSSNLQTVCVRCHEKIHDNEAKWNPLKILYKIRKDLIEERKAVNNRTRSLEKYELDLNTLKEVRAVLKEKIKSVEKQLKREVKNYEIYDWLNEVKGIGDVNAAGLISKLYPIENFETEADVWSFMGLSPENPNPEKYNNFTHYEQATKENRAMILADVGDCFIRNPDCYYRSLYDEKKEIYLEEKDWEADGKFHGNARRRMVRIFLSHLWEVWRTMEGLEPSEPYVKRKGNKSIYIPPPKGGFN